MNRMDTAGRAQVIRCLIEGNSINSTVRMTGTAKNTVLKLLVEIGASCSAYMDRSMRNLTCERIRGKFKLIHYRVRVVGQFENARP